jgi:hypothetical protein
MDDSDVLTHALSMGACEMLSKTIPLIVLAQSPFSLQPTAHAIVVAKTKQSSNLYAGICFLPNPNR